MLKLITNHRALDFLDLETLHDFFTPTHRFNLPIDILEYDSKYILHVETPGIRKEDIEIELDHERISLTVYKDKRGEHEDYDYVVRERAFGQLTRSFSIPGVDIDGAYASYSDGLLTIELPKGNQGANVRHLSID